VSETPHVASGLIVVGDRSPQIQMLEDLRHIGQKNPVEDEWKTCAKLPLEEAGSVVTSKVA